MNTYFSINPKIYHLDELKIALILSKMDAGKGVAFSEKWYDKMANSSVKPKEKTLAEFTKDYNQNFNPFNTKLRARRDLSKLVQKPGKDEDRTPNDGFQDYINKFENLATKAQFEDKLTVATQFSAGLDWQLSTMILSMASLPNDLPGWIEKAQLFHKQKLHIDELRRSTCYPGFGFPNASPSQTLRDPNAMDVDSVWLKKLTPQEHAKCMKEGRCFKCRKIGHDAKNCWTKHDTTPNPSHPSQQILHIEATPVPTSPAKPDPTPFATYAQSLGKTEKELLQTLKLCYEEVDKEVRAAETFEEFQDFWEGKMYQCHLPRSTMYLPLYWMKELYASQ